MSVSEGLEIVTVICTLTPISRLFSSPSVAESRMSCAGGAHTADIQFKKPHAVHGHGEARKAVEYIAFDIMSLLIRIGIGIDKPASAHSARPIIGESPIVVL
jgi:hypothetical protein